MRKILSSVFVFIVFFLIKEVNAQDYWFKTANPSLGTIASVFVDTTGYVFLGSNGGEISGSSDKGDTWVRLNNGLRGTNLMRSILADAKGNMFTAGTGGVWISTNHGENWANVSQGITDSFIYSLLYNQEIDTTFVNDTTFVVDTAHVLYAGTYSKGIFRSTDQGQSWTLLSGFTAPTSHVNELVSDPVTGYIFAGTYFQGMFRSPDRGTTWEQINTGLEDTYVEALTIDSLGIIYAGTHDGVFVSEDDGDTWERAGLDSIVVLSLANYNYQVFAGTDRKGVFVSDDFAFTWQNTGLENDLVHALAISNDGIVYAGLNSGNVYRSTGAVTSVEKDRNNVPDSYSLLQNYPNPFNPATQIKFDISKDVFVSLKVYNILGREVASLVNENLGAGSYNVNFNASHLQSGIYFYRLDAGSFTETKKMVLLR